MGKKKSAAKTAPQAQASSPLQIPQTEENLATYILVIQQHQPELYEAIIA
jgi:hypothetical protein